MFITLTDECQMRCAHCGMDSKPVGGGRYAKREDVLRAINIWAECPFRGKEGIGISGGEPTLHPDFLLFVRHAMKRRMGVGVITNGVNAHAALVMARLACRPLLGCTVHLSNDQYHDRTMVSDKVMEVFERLSRRGWQSLHRGVHLTGRREVVWPMGRALKLPKLRHTDPVCCAGQQKSWALGIDGRVAVCPCPGARTIGHIQDLTSLPKDGCGHEEVQFVLTLNR